ncbi:MAG TPA: type II toxin-antitoxin system VapC family toxin [Planctomycetaceae bacterium]
MLDTDVFTLLLRGNENVRLRISQTSPASLAITIITIEECLTGWYSEIRRARRDEAILEAYASLQETFEILRGLPVLSFNANALNRFHTLRKLNRRIAGNDLRIAAITMSHSGTLVTRNERDFVKIEGLRVVDWSTPFDANS